MSDVFDTKTEGTVEGVLDALVGEGKKFSTTEDLAKGKLAADNHIATIEAENARLKAQLDADKKASEKEASVKELIDTVKAAQAEGSTQGKTLSAEELAAMVKTVMKDEKSADTKAANRSRGNELVLKLAEGNVDTARLLVAQRAEALGMTPAALAAVSESSPQAFTELMAGAKSNPQSSGSPQGLDGKQRTDTSGDQTRALEIDGFKTKAWFDQQKKELGHAKYVLSPQINNELRKSINGLGERFNN